MTQNIYIDVYFAYNFLMDFIVVLITGILMKNKKNILRITMSAFLAALYSAMILVFSTSGLLVMTFTYIIIPIVMVFVAFGKTDIKSQIKRVLTLYFVTFVVSGTMNAFYYSGGFKKNIVEQAKTDIFGNISISFVLCILVLVGTFTIGVTDMIRKRIKMDRSLFPVKIALESKEIQLTALCDTGNSLMEPITRKPVSIIEKGRLEPFINEKIKYLVVPYNSVGKEHGMMNAFVADYVEVDGIVVKNAIIGIHEGKLSQNNMYQMLLHPDMMNNKEK